MKEWLQASGVGLINLFLFSWFATLPAWQIQRDGVLRGRTRVATEEDTFDIWMALFHFGVHAVVVDIWFFWTHRALHNPVLYKAIHKFHHRFKAPTAVACVYANPLEFCIGNVGGVVVGPALTNCHPYSSYFWMAFSVTATSMAHSGYIGFGATKHDQHHEFFDYNFGVMGICDSLCGTHFAGSKCEKAVLIKKTRKAI